jgi:hypothetical protein
MGYCSKPTPPCKGCEARKGKIGCHSTCEAYRAFRAALDAYNAKKRSDNETASVLARGIEKARKEQRRLPKRGRAEQ